MVSSWFILVSDLRGVTMHESIFVLSLCFKLKSMFEGVIQYSSEHTSNCIPHNCRLFVKGRMMEEAGALIIRRWRMTVYPSIKARIGAKLWENAFRTICNFSFFDAGKNVREFVFEKFFGGQLFFWKSGVLEELWISEPQWEMRRKKLLPELPLFLGRLPWRRGKWLNMCRNPWLGTKNDFNHLVLWSGDNMIIW